VRREEPSLSDAEVAAYDAPFPDVSYKAGVRAFPSLLMVEPHMEGVEESRAAELFWSEEWSGHSFMAIGARDESLGEPAMQAVRAKIRGCPEPMHSLPLGWSVGWLLEPTRPTQQIFVSPANLPTLSMKGNQYRSMLELEDPRGNCSLL